MAVYPIYNTTFELVLQDPALSEENFCNKKAFEIQVDSIKNYASFIRMTFRCSGRKLTHSRNSSYYSISSSQALLSQRGWRDFYFSGSKEVWLAEL